MKNFPQAIGMFALDRALASPALQSVHASGRLDGLLFDLTVRQTYRNAGKRTLEVVYTFPLASGAVLLGLDVELGGKRLAGVVQAKPDAERRYEQAMADGDSPILLERAADGLYTANLGNLKPGDEAVIEYRYCQLLAFEQDRVRLCIPTTIAPRYGKPGSDTTASPHQMPEESLFAKYPVSLTLDVTGALAQGEIGCATHPCSIKPAPGGVQFALGRGARMDRDVVITLAVPALASFAHSVADDAERVVLASLQPRMAPVVRERIDLKLLVDCSGSMAGQSIASARVALQHVADQLREADSFSFSRFGSEVKHDFQRLAPARSANLKMLRANIAATDADLGGTEMYAALESTFALRGSSELADVLIVTDGEIWNTEPLVAAARASGHRTFAVGVGAAPAESLLRRLAEASGGACELAAPGESLQAAIERMFARIRQQASTRLRLQWRIDESRDESDDETICAPGWTSPVPVSVFSGDTLHVFAGFAGRAPTHVRLFTEDGANGEREIASARIEPRPEAGDTLPRVAAASRLGACTETQALALALRYQLVTEHTHCIVVHERADADKAHEFAQLHRVPQMMAAGFGGMGRLGGDPFASDRSVFGNVSHSALPVSEPDRLCFSVSDSSYFDSILAGLDSPDSTPTVPASIESLRAVLDMALRALEAMVEQEALHAMADSDEEAAGSLARTLDACGDARLVDCIDGLFASGWARARAWALWLRWMLDLTGADASPEVRSALTALTASVSEAQREDAEQRFEDLWNAGRPLGAGRVVRRLRSRSSQV